MDGIKHTSCAVRANSSRRVVLVAFEGVNPVDLAGPSAAFQAANSIRPESYTLVHASPEGGSCVTQSGLQLGGLTALEHIRGPIDTLILAGGAEDALRRVGADKAFLSQVQRLAEGARRAGAVCTGAFLLGAAGLLTGRRAVTHWAACEQLAEMFEGVTVSPDAIFVRDGALFTSAGVTASIDLALNLIEEDLGHEVSSKVARHMVVFLRRPGGQAQFSEALNAQEQAKGPFADLIIWIADNLAADLSITALAERAGMSERTFQRKFKASTGRAPSAFVRAMRLEAARRWLEETDWPLKRVAERAGFGSVDTLERLFAKSYGRSPGAVRAAFKRAA